MAKWKQTSDGNWFVNPYNFVPLNGIERKSIEDWRGSKPERVTGSIHCTLTVRTPIALPDHAPTDPSRIKVEEVTGGQHFSYPFMSVDGEKPMIPGSEIRGMVRSVYEAATKSCLGILNDSILTGRSYDLKQPGVIRQDESGKWELHQGNMYRIKTFNGCCSDFSVTTENSQRFLHTSDETIANLSRVSFNTDGSNRTVIQISADISRYKRKGYLLIGEIGVKDNSSRHCSHVISRRKDARIGIIPDEAIKNLESVLKCYRDEKLNGCKDDVFHSGYVDYKLDKTGTPVFYSKVGEKYHLAPAMFSRETYYKTLDEVAGEHTPCSRIANGGNDSLCPACALFGVVRENERNGRSYGSAVRFSDALPSEYALDSDYTTLKELSSPKISSAEFYLSPIVGARTWNFEYVRIRKPKTKNEIVRRAHSAQIRGRKFYFHWSNIDRADYTSSEKTARNSSVQLLKNGTFSFDVFFDGISRKQLSELLWSLAPSDPEKPEAAFYHKIGTGKSLGLGSVEIKVNSAEIRSFDINTGEYKTESVSLTEKFAKSMARVSSELMYMLRFDDGRVWSAGYPVKTGDGTFGGISYPIADNGDKNDENGRASYQWFIGNKQISTGNRSADDGKGTDPKYSQTLPGPAEVSKLDKRLRTLKKE